MASVSMNQARALIICTRPQDYAPSRVHAAAWYLESLENATVEEQELAKQGYLFLQQAKRELPERKPAAEAVSVRFRRRLIGGEGDRWIGVPAKAGATMTVNATRRARLACPQGVQEIGPATHAACQQHGVVSQRVWHAGSQSGV